MTTRLDTRNLLLIVGVAALLAACSGATSPAATSAPIGAPLARAGAALAPVATTTDAPGASAAGGDTGNADPACALVTKDDVAKAVGFSIATVTGAGGTCFFQNADPSKYLVVQLFDSQPGMAPYLSAEDGAQHVAGLGDDAFWQGAAGFMFVRKGNRALLFLNQAWILTPPTDTTHLDSLTTLARVALPNL